MEEGGFTIVAKGSKRCAHGNRGKGPRYSPSSSAALCADDASSEDARNAVVSAMKLQEGSQWLASVISMVRQYASTMASDRASPMPPHASEKGASNGPQQTQAAPAAGPDEHVPGDGVIQEMVCYGIGHFGVSRASALQAALAVLLHKCLHIRGPLLMYDPVLTDSEKWAANELGFTLLTVNEVGLRTVSAPTLFFMPHCGRRLYSNVLRANWDPSRLAQVLIIGNSFESYRLRMLTDYKAKQSCCVERLGERLSLESRLPPAEEVDVFADTSVMTFPRSGLCTVEASFWSELEDDAGGDDHSWC